ncbi:hypothetical protein HYW32_04055 [Candidatus Berkelbacteria bacterium]|nr:hypothetical protein [Candidatus Berkelbacteria bacterium]
MSKVNSFLTSSRGQDELWLKAEIAKRYDRLCTLRFDLGFGKVGALKEFRIARRELSQLWTLLGEKVTAHKA